jgi:hypothetical protein
MKTTMKKILFLFCLCFLFIEFSEGQITFQKGYGGIDNDVARSLQQTMDGGYIITGETYSFGAGFSDVYLIKTDANGDTIWTKTFGGSNYDKGYSVKETTDGGYIVTGTTNNFGGGVYLIKTDVNGDTLWTKVFGVASQAGGYSVQQTADGGYVITGVRGDDIYLIKTDDDGNLLWSKTYGGTDIDFGNSVQQTIDGGYIIAGYTRSFGAGNADIYLIKTDGNGDTLWSKTYGGTEYDIGNFVQQTTDGGYIITGETWSFTVSPNDIYLIKTDANGDTLWTKTFGGGSDNYGTCVQQTTDAGYILAGYAGTFGNGTILIKTNAFGDTLWTKSFGGWGGDSYSVQQSTDGGYIILASDDLGTGTGLYDFYLIKTDSSGNSGCYERGAPTIVRSPPTQVTSPATIVTSPATIVTSPATIVGSGGIVTILCTSVGINEIKTDNLFIISPNPFTSEISITLQNQNLKQATISIKNILGQTVFFKEMKTPRKETKVDLSFLEKGIYLLEVVVDGERTVKKIVKR